MWVEEILTGYPQTGSQPIFRRCPTSHFTESVVSISTVICQNAALNLIGLCAQFRRLKSDSATQDDFAGDCLSARSGTSAYAYGFWLLVRKLFSALFEELKAQGTRHKYCFCFSWLLENITGRTFKHESPKSSFDGTIWSTVIPQRTNYNVGQTSTLTSLTLNVANLHALAQKGYLLRLFWRQSGQGYACCNSGPRYQTSNAKPPVLDTEQNRPTIT